MPLLARVGFFPVVIDDRTEFADARRFPDAGEVLAVRSFCGSSDGLEIDGESFVVVVTRGHAHDLEAVAGALRTPARYIGMIGSARKRNSVLAALRERGFTETGLQRVRSPIGLAIGARTPAEIAVSIVAEIIAVRAGHGAVAPHDG